MFYEIFKKNKEFARVTEGFKDNRINITGLTDSAKAHFLYGIFRETNKKLLIVARSGQLAREFRDAMRFFGVEAAIFPEREFNFYNIDAGSNELFLQRMEFLRKALTDEPGVFITTPEAFNEPVLSKEKLENARFKVELGGTVDEAELSEKLTALGYKRCDMTEFPGQFSIRGGITDIYSPHSTYPLRIELFGDEVDSLRFYDPHTQLSVENIKETEITPVSEIILTAEERKKLIEKLSELSGKAKSEKLKEAIRLDRERLENEGVFLGIDKYTDYIFPEKNTILDYFGTNETVIIYDDPQRIAEKCDAISLERGEMVTDLIEKETVIPGSVIFPSAEEVILKSLKYPVIALTGILTGKELFRPDKIFNVTSVDTPSYYGKLNLFVSDILNYKSKGCAVVIPVPPTRLSGFRSYLLSMGIEAHICEEGDKAPQKGVYLMSRVGYKGFSYPEEKFVLLFDSSIFGEYKKPLKKKKESSGLQFSDLQPGDYVVHSVHGIGKYVGTEQLVMDGIKKEFVKIKYQGTDNLYLPVNQLDSLSKYIGAGERQVKLHKLGGQEFKKVKQRVRESCAELADKLIALYAEREKTVGYAFSPDTDMQISFEQTFPYTETDDQLKSIRDVKRDMESQRPMDRLICGDVGYGKTEIALRAAFKCACEGKQTAYLAATTVLAQQHYNTFRSRMEDFPVTVEMLSRFRSKKEQEQILKKLKAGTVDIVIGTHRILSKDIEFKDLGLLIVDEEQRFGVEHKERMKEIKKNVEVLTLTATPIPRTLHMSMLGIRDMSVLSEPPMDRFPVQTYVTEYKEPIVYDAIERELSRKGQVFYLFNNTEKISFTADRLQKAFPEANVAYVHGKMSETVIERTFLKMLNGEIDILVCTTIIETGIDISNANTIIVEGSDRLGLSQLYQLRGRVGRSGRLAYCYLTYDKNKVLTEQSEGRLKAIKEFTEFGSGFRIAMRDLEIRGAGNLLGAQQHGHMDAVGYDMYIKILNSAIRAKKGEEEIEELTCRVDLREDAYIPESYITVHDMRMLAYKKVAAVSNEEEADDLVDEFTDRFSDPPLQVLSLISVSLIKSLAEQVKICEIAENPTAVNFYYFAAKDLNFEKISEINSEFRGQIMVLSGNKPGFSWRMNPEGKKNKLSNIKKILQMLK